MKSAKYVVLAFSALVVASSLAGKLPLLVPLAYVVIGAASFAVYAIDKSAARRGGWRISERVLHILDLAGGWPGGLLAQQIFRHKTKKTTFRIAFWITVLVNCLALIWLHTSEGQELLSALPAFQ